MSGFLVRLSRRGAIRRALGFACRVVRETGRAADSGDALLFVGGLSSYFWPLTFLFGFLANRAPRRAPSRVAGPRS